uniref:Uncharacterized protein n=1 Tax=Meloidogyne floridensis TaxID=298350 RepID=A0A915NR44_9BILA
MEGDHHHYGSSSKRPKITDISEDRNSVLTLDEASNIVKTIYEINKYTDFQALVNSEYIIGYYQRMYERGSKDKFKEEINFKALQMDEQKILRELSKFIHSSASNNGEFLNSEKFLSELIESIFGCEVYKNLENSKLKNHHEGQSNRKSVIFDFIEKVRGIWLHEASVNILENLGPNNEVTLLKTKEIKEKYSGKGLFSPETAKQKAEILSVELNSLFDIRFENI